MKKRCITTIFFKYKKNFATEFFDKLKTIAFEMNKNNTTLCAAS